MKTSIIKRLIILIFILSSLSLSGLIAQVNVDISVPGLGEGMAELEGMLSANTAMAAYEVETMINELLEKPLLTGAFGSAAGISGALPQLGMIPQASEIAVGLGAYGAVYADTFNVSELTERLDDIEPEDDFILGAGLNGISSSVVVPLNNYIPRFSVSASIGYLDTEGDEFSLMDFSFSAAANYSPFRKKALGQLLSWSPLYLQGGLSYSLNELGFTIEGGTFEEDFDLDPDGDGPLLAIPIIVEVEPIIDLVLRSTVIMLSATAGTGLSLVDFFHLTCGMGISLMAGKTEIGLSSSDEITVVGYLSDLIETPGVLTIDGALTGGSPSGLFPYFFGGVQFDFRHFYLNALFLYNPGYGLGGGLSMGVSL